MKTKQFLFLLLFPYLIFSQDLTKEIKIPEGAKIQDYGFSNEGSFYIVTSDKSTNVKQKKFNISIFNSKNFEQTLNTTINEKIKVRHISPDGKTVLLRSTENIIKGKSSYKFLNEKSELKDISESILEGKLYREYSKRDMLGEDDLRVKFIELMTNNAFYIIAPEEEKGIQKSILKRAFNSNSSEYSNFEVPNFNTDKNLVWTANKVLSDSIVFLAKDIEGTTFTDHFNIMVCDNKFKLLNKIQLKVSLPQGLYQVCSNDGNYTSWYSYVFDMKDGTYTNIDCLSDASGHLYVDDKNKSFYTFGLYSDEKNLTRNIKPKGFYVYKFDWRGNLIWKQVKAYKDSDFNGSQKGYNFNLNFLKINEKSIGISLSAENRFFVELEVNTGKILKEDKWKIGMNSIEELKGTYGYGREIVFAAYFNKNIYTYLKNAAVGTIMQVQNNKFIRYAKTIDSGVILFEYNDKLGECKLMKFNW